MDKIRTIGWEGNRAIQKSAVLEALGISSPTLYRLIQQGEFPRPVKIGHKASRWFESDIKEYLEKVTKQSRGE